MSLCDFRYSRQHDWKTKQLSISVMNGNASSTITLDHKDISGLKRILYDVGEVDDLCIDEIEDKPIVKLFVVVD